jgi:uncharacterized protein
MEFNVAQLLREPVGSSRAYTVDETCVADENTVVSVRGDVSLLRTDAGILVTATLTTPVRAECSRCLAPTTVVAQMSIEEEFYATVDVVTGAPLPLPDEPTAFLIDAHHILDLCEAVRQQLILVEPMQPLCRPDCAGLCPVCGSDLNSGPCKCPPQQSDARWAALRAFAETHDA